MCWREVSFDRESIFRRSYLRAEAEWLEYPEEKEHYEPDPDESYDRMRDEQLERGED